MHRDVLSAPADGSCKSTLASDYGFKSVGAELKAGFQPIFKSCLSSGERRAAARSPAAPDLSGL